jgi:hypothetical protein
MATELWFQIDDTWIPILSIPTDQFDRFTLRPLKWLSLLGIIIYGREGILQIHCDGHEVDKYDISRNFGVARMLLLFLSRRIISPLRASSLLIFVGRST